MADWIVKRSSTIIFEKEPLTVKCEKMTAHTHNSESYTALMKIDRRYYDLTLAIFMFALYDYLGVGTLVNTNVGAPIEVASMARDWICELDSLWFVGFPDMSGAELIDYIDSDWTHFSTARAAVKSYFHTRCKITKGEK